jgi:hypothetical protein
LLVDSQVIDACSNAPGFDDTMGPRVGRHFTDRLVSYP